MTNKKPKQYWMDKAKILRSLPTRKVLHVRDIETALEYSSTSATMNAINNFIELGILDFEQRGSRKEYYLK